MDNFIPTEKLSKKEKRKIALMRRGTWHGVSPVTRKAESKKIYKRKEMRAKSSFWKGDEPFQNELFVWQIKCLI
ncbi:MAG: hypothetical protein RR573_01165 [Oscillospiraceae bacterium]